MGIVSVPSFGPDPVTVTGPSLDAKVDGIATEFNGSIDNDNIKAGAAIAYSKLNIGAGAIDDTKLDLATIAQNVAFNGTVDLNGVVTVTSKIMKFAKGADVASAAGTI